MSFGASHFSEADLYSEKGMLQCDKCQKWRHVPGHDVSKKFTCHQLPNNHRGCSAKPDRKEATIIEMVSRKVRDEERGGYGAREGAREDGEGGGSGGGQPQRGGGNMGQEGAGRGIGEMIIPRAVKPAGRLADAVAAHVAGAICLMPGFRVDDPGTRAYLEGRDDKLIKAKEQEILLENMNKNDREKVGQHPTPSLP